MRRRHAVVDRQHLDARAVGNQHRLHHARLAAADDVRAAVHIDEAVILVPGIDAVGHHAVRRHALDLELVDLHLVCRRERLERAAGRAVALLHELFPLGGRRRRGIAHRHQRHRRDRIAQHLAGSLGNRNVPRIDGSRRPLRQPRRRSHPCNRGQPDQHQRGSDGQTLLHAFPLIHSDRSVDLTSPVPPGLNPAATCARSSAVWSSGLPSRLHDRQISKNPRILLGQLNAPRARRGHKTAGSPERWCVGPAHCRRPWLIVSLATTSQPAPLTGNDVHAPVMT